MASERRFLTGMRQVDTARPGLVLEDDETVWVVLPDGTRTELPSAGGSGYTAHEHEEIMAGDPVSVPYEDLESGGNRALMNLATNGSGTDLFDLSDPTHPRAIVAGVYAVTTIVYPMEPLTVGGRFCVVMHGDTQNEDFVAQQASPPYSADIGFNSTYLMAVSVSLTTYYPEDAAFTIEVWNFDGAEARLFRAAETAVQRLS